MMLNGQSGRNSTVADFAPSGPSQLENSSPAALPSRATGFDRPAPPTPASVSPVSRSRKRTLASQSLIIIARLAAVEDGASGATAAPAARMPLKAAA